MKNSHLDVKELTENLGNKELLNFGLQDMVYVRPVVMDDQELYAIHAADGTPLSIMESYENAMHKINESDMHAATIH